jgi:hypothetical protein
MAYVDQNLISGETVHYRTGLHWIVLAVPIGLGSFFGLMCLIMIFSGEAGVGSAMLLVIGLIVGSAFLRRAAAEFAVTNKRVLLKAGLLRRRSIELLLNKIESISVNLSIRDCSGEHWATAQS